jgi:hypothetical protein
MPVRTDAIALCFQTDATDLNITSTAGRHECSGGFLFSEATTRLPSLVKVKW